MTTTANSLPISLDEKYIADHGRVYLTGSQALARLPMLIRDLDLKRGLNTGGFISGYRGSPLGGLDQTLWKAKAFLKSHHIHFQPGINEDLAATAVWGSQQVNLYKGAAYDGVFALWYGKGPGVDRSMDVLKHASAAGTSRHGGVLCLAGDDHACKSSTFPHQSEQAFIASMIPVFNPATVQEFLDFGTAAIALSRYAGIWTAMKTLSETVDGSASVMIRLDDYNYSLPSDFTMPPGGLNIRWPDEPAEQEERLIRYRLPAVLAFARSNNLNRATVTGPTRRFGIVATGKAYQDTLEALESLGISVRMAAAMGISIYKVALVWPLEPHGIAAFANGLDEILVIEEKRSVIEAQLKEQLFNWPGAHRTRIVGKTDENGAELLRETLELTPVMIARVLVKRLQRFMPMEQFEERLAWLEAREAHAKNKAEVARRPYYCSGCPHNTSTVLPDGSRGMAGIGCHYMVRWMDRQTTTFTQMGGEGVPWVGQAPFTTDKHVFVNLGDGTYFHSGILAVRQAVAAGVNITYKLLYNDAVAMTGGQPVDGQLSVPMAAFQLAAEGVTRIVVVTDDVDKYDGVSLPPFTGLRHRDDLDAVQKELREVQGVTVLIYDQTCAAEKRRRRKRKLMPDPAKRIMINEAVCEGCGDCSKKSNCLSVVPVETEAGRKRQIDQSSCNKDYSCIKGFCPSFVTVEGGTLRPPPKVKDGPMPVLPDPVVPLLERPYSILVTGVGGTGVVTIGALLGMAAHIEGKGVTAMDQTGLAQKGGAVTSHVRLAPTTEDIHAPRINAGHADLLLGCDIIVSAAGDILSRMGPGITRVVLNTHESITGDFVTNPEWKLPGKSLRARIEAAVDGNVAAVDAGMLATALCGDGIAVNAFMLGYAWQLGLIPLAEKSLMQAYELNGAAVAMNKAAFQWGRRAVVDPAGVARLAGSVAYLPPHRRLSESLDEIIARRVSDLTRYQNAAYGARFKALVDRIRAVEAKVMPGQDKLTQAVALNLYRLMAYKDEYEVARLYTDGEFLQQLRDTFTGSYKLKFHLAPPIFSRIDPATGEPKKITFGPWMLMAFRFLAKFKALRGTGLDPFGRTAERRMERQLIADYEALLTEFEQRLTAANHTLAIDLASIPSLIRGYGPVKERNLEQAKTREAGLLARFRGTDVKAIAAE